MEYAQMAKFYDELYSGKDYKKEIDFLEKFLPEDVKSIFDAGCGTGTHCKRLQEHGYNINGIDISNEMVELANRKCGSYFEVGNLLHYSTTKRYGAIISMFAVFNHLKSYSQFKKGVINLLNLTNDNGIIIIDLHNPQKSGSKTDSNNNIKREMKWKIYRLFRKEYSTIVYKVDDKIYKSKHIFKIFNLHKIKNIIERLNCSVKAYENFDNNISATQQSKNIQLVIKKL